MHRSHVCRRLVILSAVGLAGAGAVPVSAQSGRFAAAQSQTAAASASPLSPISVRYSNTPLATVLDDLARRGGVRVSYTEAVATSATRVTITIDEMPVADAFARVLRGTGFGATQIGREEWSVVARAPEKQAQGTIQGRVISAKTKQPVGGATITLDDARKGIVTSEDGTYRIPAPAGDHTLHVRGIGFTRYSSRVTVADDQTVTVNVSLEPTASVLDEVVVTGTVVATERKAVPTPITVFTAEDIQKRGITRIDQFLRGEVPGVVSVDRGTLPYMESTGGVGAQLGQMATSNVYARGSSTLEGSRSSSNPLKTYIDGVELLNSDYLGTIDPQSIERIEIITGPQAATLYGSGALGGVMQIFTKKGTGSVRPDMTLSLKFGTMENSYSKGLTPRHNHTFNVMGGNGPSFSYSGSMSYNYSGQWQPGLYSRNFGSAIGATHTRGPVVLSGSFSVTSGKNGTSGYSNSFFDGYGMLSQRAKIESGEWLGLNGLNTGSFFNKRESTSSNQTASLSVDYRPLSFWNHHFVVGRSQNTFNALPSAPALASPSDTLYKMATSTGQRTTLNYNTTLTPERLGPLSSTLTLGGSGSWGQNLTVTACNATKSTTSYGGCFGNGPGVSKSLDTRSVGGFGSVQLGAFDHVFLTLGLRGERNPNYGRAHKIDWTPTNGLTFTVEHGDLTIKALGSYGRATRPPSPEMRNEVIYDGYTDRTPSSYVARFEAPDLTPEYSRGPQGGIEMYYGNLGSLTINRYVQRTSDLIQNVRVDSTPYTLLATNEVRYVTQTQYQNTATIRAQGWDGTATLNLGPLTAKGTYSWSESRILYLNPQAGGFYVWQNYGKTTIITGIPTHTGNLTLSYAHGPTSMTLVTNFTGHFLQTQVNPVLKETSVARLKQYVIRRSSWDDVYPVGGYAKSDLAVSHRLSPWVTATMNVENLGNNYQSDLGIYYPTLGRQMSFGLSFRNASRR